MNAETPRETPKLHLIKLSVGTESVDGLAQWQAQRSAERAAQGLDPRPRHVTRMWPRREAELLQGGSIYWVICGIVSARQRIETLEEVIREDGIRRCGIVLTPGLIRVEARPRKPFQGWRYLPAKDAPADLDASRQEEADLPAELRDDLIRLGILG